MPFIAGACGVSPVEPLEFSQARSEGVLVSQLDEGDASNTDDVTWSCTEGFTWISCQAEEEPTWQFDAEYIDGTSAPPPEDDPTLENGDWWKNLAKKAAATAAGMGVFGYLTGLGTPLTMFVFPESAGDAMADKCASHGGRYWVAECTPEGYVYACGDPPAV